ncbi:YsnF/AvaK domain-containing protein [Kribbella sp. NBC_00382]|uniref:YsnF/AvaK domain-containing protein n=1 Tax=Kribbella sp. NBC_00382 TaxID=2975967 RepID=UPI002E1E27EF
MSTTQELERAMGQDVYDVEGHKVGTASHLYASDVSGAPEWVTVKTGLFGSKESFVPLTGAHTEQDGLHVGAHKDVIKDAPRIDDNGHLSEAEAAELYRHYNLQTGTPGMNGQPGMDGQNAKHAQGKDSMGKDARQGMAGQESMIRSEEQLRAGTETVETGRVRLQKHVVTEEQQITVPVSHEEVRVVREPMTGTEPGTGKIQEDEREVVLHEERPVVAKETVAVERVGLETETVHEETQIKDTVRKEQIEVDDTTNPRKH